jgi:hypothetical protein
MRTGSVFIPFTVSYIFSLSFFLFKDNLESYKQHHDSYPYRENDTHSANDEILHISWTLRVICRFLGYRHCIPQEPDESSPHSHSLTTLRSILDSHQCRGHPTRILPSGFQITVMCIFSYLTCILHVPLS